MGFTNSCPSETAQQSAAEEGNGSESDSAERSRNKERLEASLAGLCELERLKQRQECRVLNALCLGDSPVSRRQTWGALRAHSAPEAPNGDASDDYGLRLQTSSLQCTPWGIMASLEQQVAHLKVNAEVKSADSSAILEESQLSSGEVLVVKQDGSPELNYNIVVPCSLSVETETREIWLSDSTRWATVTDALVGVSDVDTCQEDHQQAQKVETYIYGLIQRRALPSRPSKPRTSLAHDARAVSVVRQNSFCHKEEKPSPKQVSVQESSTLSRSLEGTAPQDQRPYTGPGFPEDAPPPYHHHLKQSVQHQPGLYHKPRQASMINTSHPTLLDYPSSRVLQAHPDTSNSEPDSPQHFANSPSPPGLSKLHQLSSPDEQLVNAEYIPAQPCQASTRGYAHHHSIPHKGSGAPKPNRSTYSPERGHHHQEQQSTASQIQPSRSRGGPKKCRSNEDRTGATKKQGKKAYRSQSENSLQRVPERKYNTVDRDGGGSGSGGRGSRSSQSRGKKQQQGSGSYRRWQSTLELSQDEADQPAAQTPIHNSSASNQRDHYARRTRKSRPMYTSYAHPHHNLNHHHSHHHQLMEYQLERDQVPMCQPSEDYPNPGQGESESSMSEADSPDSSSLSSDSDESGGLVWPQQLPPQLSLPLPPAPPGAPLQPKAFVKIKASHALKRKILRFRTGSLKLLHSFSPKVPVTSPPSEDFPNLGSGTRPQSGEKNKGERGNKGGEGTGDEGRNREALGLRRKPTLRKRNRATDDLLTAQGGTAAREGASCGPCSSHSPAEAGAWRIPRITKSRQSESLKEKDKLSVAQPIPGKCQPASDSSSLGLPTPTPSFKFKPVRIMPESRSLGELLEKIQTDPEMVCLLKRHKLEQLLSVSITLDIAGSP
ncbi:hypothetical protein PAMP_007578 [Pampus punctatissimus]